MTNQDKKYFEEYVENYTKVYAEEIKKYPAEEYQRLLLCVEDNLGEIQQLGLTKELDSNYWEGIYHEVQMDQLNQVLSEAGFDDEYDWLMETEVEEDGEWYEGEEEIIQNNWLFHLYIHWHCLAKIAFNLLNEPTLKTHLGKISKIEITSGSDIVPKYTRFVPELSDKEKIINAISGDSKTVELLLDGWGNTFNGHYLKPMLEELYEPSKIQEIISKANAKKEKKLPSNLNGQLETLLQSVKMFCENEDFRCSFGKKIEEGKWAGYWYGRLPDNWRCIYKFSDDGNVEIGDIIQDNNLE